jgi:hypothetical protein
MKVTGNQITLSIYEIITYEEIYFQKYQYFIYEPWVIRGGIYHFIPCVMILLMFFLTVLTIFKLNKKNEDNTAK